ncbi:MAG: hypothetical protein ACFFFG_07455 [Candidatus Thorarchaeota archaeon]
MKSQKVIPIAFLIVICSLAFATQIPMMFGLPTEGGGSGSPSYPRVDGNTWMNKQTRPGDDHYGTYLSGATGYISPLPHVVEVDGENSHGAISLQASIEHYAGIGNYDEIRVRFTTYYKSKLPDPSYPSEAGIIYGQGVIVEEVEATNLLQVVWFRDYNKDQWAWPKYLKSGPSYEAARISFNQEVIDWVTGVAVLRILSRLDLTGIVETVTDYIVERTVKAAFEPLFDVGYAVYGNSGVTGSDIQAQYAFINGGGYPWTTYQYYDRNSYINEASTHHSAGIRIFGTLPSYCTLIRAKAYVDYYLPNSYGGGIDTIYSPIIQIYLV